ncbi:MAG: MMPL family transporter, partial [Clostridiales bacterium]|nr:MMPL family transporter [Clostridiales bacterium]
MLKKIADKIVDFKYIIIGAMLVLAVVCVFLLFNVNVNYDLTKYLGKNSDTAMSLEIMNDEFGHSGSAEVMVKDVTFDQAKELQSKIAAIKGVQLVNFFNNDQYFKDEDGDGYGNALLKIIIKDGDYSALSEDILHGIEAALDGYELEFNGASSFNMSLKDRIESEIILMTVLAIIIAAIVLFLTSSSWFEPILFGIITGTAILINMGTNIFLGEISYVTNAVAAIIQLALSMDYVIILLHQFNSEKASGLSDADAMKAAIKRAFSPVSSSSLTTIAGLAAVMLMSFKIGFDIGLVLSKAILCSAFTVFLLMPTLTLVFSKPIRMLSHKPIFKTPKKERLAYANFIDKYKKFFALIFLFIFIGSYIVQSGAIFNYVEDDKRIKDQPNGVVQQFGENNLMMLIIPRTYSEEDIRKQNELIEWLKSQTKKDGSSIYKEVLSSATTTNRRVTADEAAALLGLDKELIQQLFGMYYFETGVNMNGNDKISLKEFIRYVDDVISGEKDIPLSVDAALNSVAEEVYLLRALIDTLDSDITAGDLYALLNDDALKDVGFEFPSLPLSYIEQVFGMYYLSSGYASGRDNASLLNIINYMDDNIKGAYSSGIRLSEILSEREQKLISAFAGLLNMLDKPMTPKQFFDALSGSELKELGVALPDNLTEDYIRHIYAYYAFKESDTEYKIAVDDFVDFLDRALSGETNYTVDISELLSGIEGGAELASYAGVLNEAIKMLKGSFTPEELFAAVLGGGFEDVLGISLSDSDVEYFKQLYGMYYYASGALDGYDAVSLYDLVSYLNYAADDDESLINKTGLFGESEKVVIKAFYALLELFDE